MILEFNIFMLLMTNIHENGEKLLCGNLLDFAMRSNQNHYEGIVLNTLWLRYMHLLIIFICMYQCMLILAHLPFWFKSIV